MRKLSIAFIILLFVNNSFAQKKIPPDRPKLVIGIVIDQMRYDYIYRYWDKFGENGFKKLFNEGTFCHNTKYNYLLTESAPGYATIVTGTSPSEHGIVSNQWYHRLKKEFQYCVRDQKVRGIGFGAESGRVSPKRMLSSGFMDELRLSNFKQSKVISVAMNDFAAVLSGGHLANAAYWYDNKTGNWVSSSYYQNNLPDWVVKFNAKKFTDIYISHGWDLLLDKNQYNQSMADNNSYEYGFDGHSHVFPYDLQKFFKKEGYEILKFTPYGNTYTKDFAISALVNENLGQDEFPDFLSIGFSACGHVSDIFGIRSLEMEDMYLRLDKDLEHLLKSIDELVGKENVLVYLTADHGASDHPSFLKDVKMPGNVFNMSSTLAVLKSYLRAIYGEGEWILAYYNRQIYLNQVLIEDSKIPLEEIQTRIAQFLVQFTGIANAVTATTFQTTNFTKGILEKSQNSYNQERSGDIILNFAPGWTENDAIRSKKTISSQYSAYSYDTHVPLIWYGWKIKRININRTISITDIAPTLSLFLKIPYPNACVGEPILELLN